VIIGCPAALVAQRCSEAVPNDPVLQLGGTAWTIIGRRFRACSSIDSMARQQLMALAWAAVAPPGQVRDCVAGVVAGAPQPSCRDCYLTGVNLGRGRPSRKDAVR
jgi:hypothetical protein